MKRGMGIMAIGHLDLAFHTFLIFVDSLRLNHIGQHAQQHASSCSVVKARAYSVCGSTQVHEELAPPLTQAGMRAASLVHRCAFICKSYTIATAMGTVTMTRLSSPMMLKCAQRSHLPST